MRRACIRWFRQVTGAGLLLAFVVCAAEVALRAKEAMRAAPADRSFAASLPLLPSPATYASLRPYATIRTRSPATQQSVEYRLNSFGLRGPEPLIPKPPGTVRILCLGGEQFFGAQTSDDAHFCQRLQAYLQGRSSDTLEILNAAVPGASPCTQYLRLKHELSALQPDYVLLEIDPVFLSRGLALQRWTRSDSRGQPLTSCHPTLMSVVQNSSSRKWREEFRVLDGLACLAGARLLNPDTGGTATTGLHEQWESSLGIVPHLAGLVGQWGGQLVVWSTPDAGLAPEINATRLAEALEPVMTQASVSWCDVTVLHRDVAVQKLWSPGGRAEWTEQGHQELAEAVASFMLARVPGPWNSSYDRQGGSSVQPAAHQSAGPLR